MVLASISGSVDRAFTVFFAWLPALVGAIVVLLIGYVIAKVIGGLVSRVTHRAGLDRTLHNGPGGSTIQKVTPHPSRLAGAIVFWAILLSAISLAASVLHIKALTAFVGAVWGYLPNVIAAVAIFIVAGLVATAVAALASRLMGDTGVGRVVATGVPILVMAIATFMILDQLKIAHNIVVITYAAILGAIALGSALAFGLGGREVAARMLEGAYANVQQNKNQWKSDLDRGVSRARDEAESIKRSVDDDASTRVTTAGAARRASSNDARYSVTDTPASELEN
jgi:Conserved TM helix